MEKSPFGSNESKGKDKQDETFVPTWYELSGLATYGINEKTGEIAKRGYMLYEGINSNQAKRGEWKSVGKLTNEQLEEIKTIIKNGQRPDSAIEFFLISNGDLVPSVDRSGTPIVVEAKGEEWEEAARQEWLSWEKKSKSRAEEANKLADWMEEAAKKWRAKNPDAGGGELDYKLEHGARDIRRRGYVNETEKEICRQAGWLE